MFITKSLYIFYQKNPQNFEGLEHQNLSLKDLEGSLCKYTIPICAEDMNDIPLLFKQGNSCFYLLIEKHRESKERFIAIVYDIKPNFAYTGSHSSN